MSNEPTRRGGTRPGAGRPALSAGGKRTMREIYLQPSTWAAIDTFRGDRRLTASAAIDRLVRDALGLDDDLSYDGE